MVITNLVAATDGAVWLSTGSDVYHFAGGNWARYTPEDGLRSAESVKTINKLIDNNKGLY